MNRQDAERIAIGFLKPVYGFALKRCRNAQDAEDLSQEIAVKIFRALLRREDIADVRKFAWTIAHNALSNYYRGNSRSFVGVSIDELGELADREAENVESALVMQQTISKLHGEIAYLSKLQRRIVIAYYYERKTQGEIAQELNIPVGTVKWHLFEARKDLRKGMETMRNPSELKFNPIRFALCGTNGSTGTKGMNSNFFRSALSQNIEYAVWKSPKTVNEIADLLGVSPVYVESEAEYLEEYGFLTKRGEKYLCNILLEEPDEEIIRLHDEAYEGAASLIANELFDALSAERIWEDPNVRGGRANGVADRNFMMWALFPYIAALSGESMMDEAIAFEDVATLRPDGGHNICQATVHNAASRGAKYFESMQRMCGPYGIRQGDFAIWQIDTEWSEKRLDDLFVARAQADLKLLRKWLDGQNLSAEECAQLIERGIMKNADGEMQCLWIEGSETRKHLMEIGDRIREKHFDAMNALKKSYIDAVLQRTPAHLRAMQGYVLQYMFYVDGWFVLHCMKVLVNNGKLKLPTEDQRRALSMIIIHE